MNHLNMLSPCLLRCCNFHGLKIFYNLAPHLISNPNFFHNFSKIALQSTYEQQSPYSHLPVSNLTLIPKRKRKSIWKCPLKHIKSRASIHTTISLNALMKIDTDILPFHKFHMVVTHVLICTMENY